ncbi:MAG: sugar ABC transporter substrate-binding protein [Actinobacteria bacterium]|nr:MAG: sugar ABC transporter substrate-binding protein [Actinomycetota bacterium]
MEQRIGGRRRLLCRRGKRLPRHRLALAFGIGAPTPGRRSFLTKRRSSGLTCGGKEEKNVRWATAALAVIVAAGLLVAAASARVSSPTKQAASIKACALLPDTTSSTRYTLFDAPYLKAAFKKANVAATVVNAHNDPQKQKSQAQQCLAQGAKVILLDQLDPASGASITNLAVAGGAKVIDYDRLVVKSKASYYVSFNNVTVGKLQGKGLVAGLKAKGTYSKHPVIAQLNGDIKDNNAILFKQGYDSILNPLFKSGTFKKATAGDQYTEWSATKARTIFDQMLARNGNKINGVLAANDGLAGAVVASLKAHGLKPVPLTGQDATPTGVQFILAGWQTGTVYKSVRLEANAAAAAAIAIINGKPVPGVNGKVSGTKSILLKPVWITKSNYTKLFTDGFLKKGQVCNGIYAKYCK